MPLVARDDSLLTVIDLQPRFWGERLDADDKRRAEVAARPGWRPWHMHWVSRP